MGSSPVGGSEKKFFSEYFDLRTLLRYLHFIQVTIHLSIMIVWVTMVIMVIMTITIRKRSDLENI